MTTGIAASQLASMDRDQLYGLLGSIHKESKLAVFNTLALEGEATAITAQSDVEVGAVRFTYFNKKAYEFFCGDCGDDPGQIDCLDHLKAVLDIKADQAEMITALAALLIASFGWSELIAGIVAACLIKFVLSTTLQALCVEWKAKLEDK